MTNDRSKPAPQRGRREKESRRLRETAEARSAGEERLSDDALVDEASQESFPASDPPSFMGGSRPGRPPR